LLEEYGADGLAKNVDDICPIDMAITEDIKDIKMHFMSLPKYKNYDFFGTEATAIGDGKVESVRNSSQNGTFTFSNTQAFAKAKPQSMK